MEKFTPAEMEVMQVLWRESPLKPAEILERLERPISNPALRSILRVRSARGKGLGGLSPQGAGGGLFGPGEGPSA